MIERKKLASFVAVAVAPVLIFMVAIQQPDRTASNPGDMITGQVRKGSFDVRVQLVGYLEAARSITICSELKGESGKIIYLVPNGTRVEKDDILVRFDPTPFENEVVECSSKHEVCKANVLALQEALKWEANQASQELNTAEYELEVSKMELNKIEKGEGPLELAQLENEMQKARDDYTEKSSYLADLQELEKEGFSNPTEVAQALRKISEAKEIYEIAERKLNAFRDYLFPTKVEMARAKVEKAKSNLEQAKNAMTIRTAQASAELTHAEEELKAAETSLNTANQQLSKTVIKATVPGLAIIREVFIQGEKRKIQVGDTVWRNQSLLYLPDVSEMLVSAEVREVDLHKVKVDLPATVSVDAYPEVRLKGSVQSIGVLAEKRTGVKSPEKYFQVLVALLENDDRLRPGMTAAVDILSGSVADILFVPVNALFEEEGRQYCYVTAANGYELREVSVGLQNDDFAEIKNGLYEGEKVCLIKPPSTHVRIRKLLEEDNGPDL